MDNYEYCARFASFLASDGPGPRTLDFGCGAGEIVSRLRQAGIEAFGTDVFYEGGDYSRHIPEGLRPFILRSEDGLIPFPDESFDLVITNQVFEHVEKLEQPLSEIHRVLRPGGRLLCLFPDRGVWREGHCGIPFLHWFPKRSRIRIRYAMVLRFLGLGYHKGNKSIRAWSEDFCNWLDQWTFYRPRREIRAAYASWFSDCIDLEPHWLLARSGRLAPIVGVLPGALQRLVTRKLAGLVFVCTRGERERMGRPVSEGG
ncbi:MAG TPA: methyltransferase domain-containing protein [Thermoanaerobaculia bacterium]|nr:methyltransferase domain-containing protein [Thermoanaerobaculia bacterium]